MLTDLARRRHRRGRAAAVAVLCMGLVATPMAPATGQSTRSRLSEAQKRYKRVQEQLNRLADQYSDKQNALDETRAKISATNRRIRDLEERSTGLRQQLKDRVRTAYRMGGLGFVQFLLSAESFRDFSLRVVLLERQASLDEDLLLQLERIHGELGAEQRALEGQKQVQASQVSELRNQVGQVNATFSEASRILSQLRDQLRAEELAALFRNTRGGGGGGGRTVGLQACPAAGPHAFSNDWGAPRGGGSRRHQGNDILAPNGSPAAAVVSGRITRLSSGGLGGLAVYLWGDDNVEYYYAHMSGFAVGQGARVSAGQTIAYVGNTGNARGGPPHIHFEVHPGGGAPINPYPSLIRVC